MGGRREGREGRRQKTPEDLLSGCWRPSPGEFERVRQLLANAPGGRAWHRRGWLVILRSSTPKAGAAVRDDGGHAGKCPAKRLSDVVGDEGGGDGQDVDLAVSGGDEPPR